MLEAMRLKALNEDNLIGKRGVVGVGVGHKWVDGMPSDTPAILVFVEKKRTKRGVTQKFSAADIIPTTIEGIPTDVIEVGRLVKQGFTQRVRPIKPGYSCGHRDITAGTIGGVFMDSDGDPVILSNNHVLANENKAQTGDVIYQPGPYDSKKTRLEFVGWPDPIAALPYVATLKQFNPINADGNYHDSATAKIYHKIVSAGLVDSLYPVLNKPCIGFGQATTGLQVQKCGRTTGYTTGRVLGVNASFTIQYDFGPAKFNDCLVFSPMSQGGDSGSLIFDMNMKAVGLLFAGSDKVTIANPMNLVVDAYGLKLWNPTVASGVDTLDFGDQTWQSIADTNSSISNNGKLVTISANANRFACLESPISDFNSVSVIVNTGSDVGATWGPGLVAQWPTGALKVNVRHGSKFGGYFNGTENINIGFVKPNTDYMLRIRKSNNHTYVGEVRDGNRWFTVIEVPISVLPHSPVKVRVGKTDLNGQPTSYNNPSAIGVCTFREFAQT